MPVFESEFRERLSRTTLYFYSTFRAFAEKHNDTTFEARMALALARCFFTSTRFELQYDFAKEMCHRAHLLMERVLAHEGKPWDAFKIPEIVKLAGALPPAIDVLRIVEIEGVDVQADGGCHVKNTSEVGEIEFVKAENKGKENRRVYFRLKD